MHSNPIIGALLKFCLAILFLKFVVFGSWFKPPRIKGPGYSVLKPAGWEFIQDATGVQLYFRGQREAERGDVRAPEKIPGTSVPEASIAVLVVKLANPTWMEDEFPTLLDAWSKAGYLFF